MPNALAAATSPYLLQHADNPVDWREWNEVTLALARSQNRPILLSVGYAACHWCHVMAHESFEHAGNGGGHEPAVRQYQGRPRGAAGPRYRLSTGLGRDGPAGWLAAHHVPHSSRRAVLGRNLLSARATIRPPRLRAGAGASGRALAQWQRARHRQPQSHRRGASPAVRARARRALAAGGGAPGRPPAG